MLFSLHIENIALINDISASFENGLIVLTGETGAGKSLVVDSINLCLGMRASRELITSNQKKALVEAQFVTPSISDSSEQDYDTTIISREIFMDGRNVCKLNGRLVTLSELRETAIALINIHEIGRAHV